jgi:hypothetical protein
VPKVEDLKMSVLEALNKQVYDVEVFYKNTGPFQAVARSAFFQDAMCIIIALNTVWIAIETDYNKASPAAHVELFPKGVYLEGFFYQLLRVGQGTWARRVPAVS